MRWAWEGASVIITGVTSMSTMMTVAIVTITFTTTSTLRSHVAQVWLKRNRLAHG